MTDNYKKYAQQFKALSDPNRLMILDILSCGELCACVILEKFNITQPTLSHHMKTLCDTGLVCGRKVGKWIYYSLNQEVILAFREFFVEVTSFKENCICFDTERDLRFGIGAEEEEEDICECMNDREPEVISVD